MAKDTIPTHAKYYSQNINEMWSFKVYPKYKDASWDWWHLPFDDNNFASKDYRGNRFISISNPVEKKNIIEIGSAMGQGYNFLKNSSLIDVSDYTGIEVSHTGHNYCKDNYPETTWIQSDFTKYEFERDYDYAFERNAVHHMPNPIAQYQKLLGHVTVSAAIHFRGCIEGKTISDLEKGFFRNEEANDCYYYLNVINIFEVVKVALDEGFNHIRVVYGGLHEPIPKDPKKAWYLAPELQETHVIARFSVRASRCPRLNKLLLYAVPAGPRVLIKEPWNYLKISLGLKRLIKM
jgi:hypothetical protein